MNVVGMLEIKVAIRRFIPKEKDQHTSCLRRPPVVTPG